MTKRIRSFVYTYGKFGKGFREILDTENKFLYSHGRYPTKIVAEDLKDDFVYISYKEPLKKEMDEYGYAHYTNYDACFCGPDILDIAHAVEKYSHLDISHIRKGMKEKVRWLKKNEPDFYETCFHGKDKEFLKKIDSKW